MGYSQITQAELKAELTYDRDTGEFIWRHDSAYHKSGAVAGWVKDTGHRVIDINSKKHHEHRLAWLYVYGYLPEHGIDHINRNPADNRIKNLREASQTCNMRNTGNRKNNVSGVKGVSRQKGSETWNAFITVNYKNKYLGCSKDFDEAVCIRLAAEQCLDWAGCDDRSPAYRHVQKMFGRE